MTARRVAARQLLAALAALTLLAGCGGGGAADAERAAAERAAATRAYAANVSQVTQRTSARLAEISAQADYRDAVAAAQSTREYAASIRLAADDLAQAKPPATVATQHRALTALYRTTADRMDALAADFASARTSRALAKQAQRLSGEVQNYSTEETQIRTEIERRLAAPSPPK